MKDGIRTVTRGIHSPLQHSHSDKGHPQSTSTPGLCHKHPESDINDTIPHVKSTRKSQMLDKKNEDHWQWDGKETLIRIHKRRDGRTLYHRIAKTVLVTLGSYVMRGKLNKSSKLTLE